MGSIFQNVKTIRPGMRCKINVPNHTGHSVLTTYDPEIEDSAIAAQDAIGDFWDKCIDEMGKRGSNYRPTCWAQSIGEVGFKMVPDPRRLDLTTIQEVMVQAPLAGG